MQLSEQQVQRLFEFTQKKFVYWYDLQIELVDHLASNIEEAMNADPGLGFEAALDKVYKRFGIFGFAKIVQEKSEQLYRTSRGMWWNEIRSFITWPKIIVLALIFTFLWQLSSWFDANVLMIIFIVVYVASSIFLIWYSYKTSRLRKKLMILQTGPFHFSFFVFVYECVILSRNADFTALGFCICATIGILVKIASFQLYTKVKQKAMGQYPEAF